HEKRLVWSPWTPQSAGLVSAFGKLTGLDGVRPVRRIEVQPYASSRLTRAPGDPRDPFYERSDLGGSLGADFKLGLSSGLTLTGTINPDFGQVEVDPAVVNLTAFETFFPEKRPFFIEGAEVFRFGQVRSFNRYSFQQFFYSRRIGRPPRLGVSEADVAYSEQPDQTTILGAAKVTGKAGAWTIGMMDALTAREQARFVTSTGLEDESAVEPLSNSFVGRLRRELRGGSTVIGGMATAVHRRLETAAFEQALPRRAFLGGIDFQHGWAGRAWDLSGFVVASRVQGTSTVISALQQASARYYQRPDAQAVELDPTRVRLDGHMADLALTHTGTWDLSLDYKQASPGFEMNDLGFHGRTDYRSFSTFAGRRVNRTGRVFREHNYFAFTNHAWNWDGDVIFDAYAVGANGTFQNLWWTGMNLGLERDALSDRLTRGGPLAQDPGGWWFNVRGGSDSRKRLSAAGFLFYSQGNAGSHERSAELELDFRPSSAVRVRLGPSLGRSASPAQYLQTEPDSLALDTYGRRYVFAEIERTTLSMDTRVDWTFSPTLSLQLYAQPFLATGDFRDFKEFRVPRTFAFDVYSRDRGTIQRVETRDGVRYDVDPDGAGPAAAFSVAEPDFNVRSLRGNAVLRWEYRPGSVLYLVWQQNRSGFAPTGEFDFRRDARGIFRAPGTNLFLVKVTYWLGL
ncbi:MAG: hypothetical protein HY561_10015, partial [Gemmatimonadetes bacterium]|nr:hypothetical protein [Gemmatimonadota bacterium]